MLRAQGDHYFAMGRFHVAASLYAQTVAPLEEVALRFMNIDPEVMAALVADLPAGSAAQSDSARYALVQNSIQDALKLYLVEKLNRLESNETTQKVLLATWIAEMYMKQLNACEGEAKDKLSDVRTEFYQWLALPHVKVGCRGGVLSL